MSLESKIDELIAALTHAADVWSQRAGGEAPAPKPETAAAKKKRLAQEKKEAEEAEDLESEDTEAISSDELQTMAKNAIRAGYVTRAAAKKLIKKCGADTIDDLDAEGCKALAVELSKLADDAGSDEL